MIRQLIEGIGVSEKFQVYYVAIGEFVYSDTHRATLVYAKSFIRNATILSFRMSLEPFTCPYCHAQNQKQINEVTITDTLTLKAFGHGQEVLSKVPIYQVKCRLCFNEYEPLKMSDWDCIKHNLLANLNMLQTFKTRFPTQNNGIDAIFNNVVAIARPKKSITDKLFGRNPHLHIFFVLDGIQAYVDCEQVTVNRKTFLRGLEIGYI